MRPFTIHFGFEFRTGLRNPAAMLLFYLFPLGFYLLMGVVMVEINPTFAETLIPALVVVTIMAGTILGFPSQLVDARDAGVHRSFKVNGVGVDSILAIPLLAASVHVILASIAIAATAGPLFGATVPTDWLGFAVALLAASVTFAAIAALIGVASSNSRATVLWSQLVFLPSMLVGGVMLDMSTLPDSVLPLAKLLPSTYAMQAFEGAAFSADTLIDPGIALLVLLAGGLGSALLARELYTWDAHGATRQRPRWLALLAVVPFTVAAILL